MLGALELDFPAQHTWSWSNWELTHREAEFILKVLASETAWALENVDLEAGKF